MQRISRNLTLIYRTERLIARRRLAVLQRQIALMLVAGLAGLAGLVLLNIALFFALRDVVSAAGSAAILAVGNLTLAMVFVLIAGRMSAEAEIAPAIEMRDMAMDDLEQEIDDMAEEGRKVVDALVHVGRDPFGSLATLLVPLLGEFLRKRRRDEQDEPAAK